MTTLFDKFYGCIAGAHIGSAMGAAVEGMLWPEIQEKYGTLKELLPYEHYQNGWLRPAGTTEDGIERQKLMISAIMDKGGRVSAEDVRNAWVKYIKPISIGMVSEPFEATLLAMAKTTMPANHIGIYCDYAGLNSFARACHPIGLINAGDPLNAKEDALEVGQLYQTSQSRGLKWATVTAVSIAEATKPHSTVESVISAIFEYCDPDIVLKELERELNATKNISDFRDLRVYFDTVYSGQGIPYAFASANEVVTKAICIFQMTRGSLFDAMIAAVNMGRDTDCVAAVAAGIAGAFSGIDKLPKDLITMTDEAAKANQYTNTNRTLEENARGLFDAYMNRLKKQKELIDMMEHEYEEA